MGNITILIFAAVGACVGAFMFFYFVSYRSWLRGPPGHRGMHGKDGLPGEDGKDGLNITSAIVDTEGQLVITFSNGDSYTSKSLIGPQGPPGRTGKDAKVPVNRGLRRKNIGQVDPGQGVV